MKTAPEEVPYIKFEKIRKAPAFEPIKHTPIPTHDNEDDRESKYSEDFEPEEDAKKTQLTEPKQSMKKNLPPKRDYNMNQESTVLESPPQLHSPNAEMEQQKQSTMFKASGNKRRDSQENKKREPQIGISMDRYNMKVPAKEEESVKPRESTNTMEMSMTKTKGGDWLMEHIVE